MLESETIAAAATPAGVGGIAVIRVSGPMALEVVSKSWRGISLGKVESHTAHLGWITDASGDEIDQGVATVFRGPRSYTGEDVVEISVHGSPWIQNAVLNRLIECGARPASAGEFTRRAFMNGRLDLAQAEGVADMIASSSRAAAKLAATQLRGDFSRKLDEMRERLTELGTLLELELDFSEEEVEFADRSRLISLTDQLHEIVERLASSYKSGNAFKNGFPVAIAGVPNAGKSTLLNALVGEEKAIVSDIPGTTRDVIEDTIEIEGILFRFFDTAGLRESEDVIEKIGVERARSKISESALTLVLIDPTQSFEKQKKLISDLKNAGVPQIKVLTKSDLKNYHEFLSIVDEEIIPISAKSGEGMEELKTKLIETATSEFNPQQELIVTNSRHYDALRASGEALMRLREGLKEGISADFLAQDLREAIYHLGEITGKVTSEDLLHNIFSRYCIGK